MMANRKEGAFHQLAAEARACVLCPRMANSSRVVGLASGSVDAPLFIVGEAPGRLGADASAIPFHGDKAGDNFESLIKQVGLSREDFFITNAALCNPRDESGNNATPSRAEIQNCSTFLKRQIDLVSPRIVVTLGAQALNAIKAIEAHDIELASGVRQSWRWYGRVLIPLYHPGQRAMIHRSFFNQLADYQFLAETFVRACRKPKAPNLRPTLSDIAAIAKRLAGDPDGISYFALHKLFYLAEYEFYRRTSSRMTSAYIVRQKEGPYVFELHIKKLKSAIQSLETWTHGNRLMVRSHAVPGLFSNSNDDRSADDVIDFILEKYGRRNDGDLKRAVYLTAPMRHILHQEKTLGMNMFNRALDFSFT
jgi:uracil-DNA glycosylase family 4